ncbi:putative ATP-grasp superfamily ATP-dependent carboligase [Thermosporothrix hazakensis]|jgi:predicted ATP-grasp superfamily ATP-dependent carboligase|uniref:ATP-grasp domain-containing protein n=2 Tax=Thermosporothrix TaxID=768650 RepID=A0A455SNM1_9CHLR|nr:ATP-grasp domain-containing protein [Thermosporothrix hazakensis]PZW22941.1 putative ATP-grasp superfamily ATP-dependent carboligase [Thermosporothrix hazakensis]BBH90033.1 hypothetical protein KTC_47840 [Thermosporothrix sp. COM3]GCE48254.1 hypothetical protein KTH_31230 [Thermosporothrix hazakensis]
MSQTLLQTSRGTTQVEHSTYLYDALILEAHLRQALATVRSLGRRGLQVAVMDQTRHAPAYESRWCRKAYICPTGDSAEIYFQTIKRCVEYTRPRVLFVSSNATAEIINRYRAKLEKRVRLALSPAPGLRIALDKEATLQMAREQGLSVPRTVTVTQEQDIKAALRDIGLPAILKPALSWTWETQPTQSLTSQLVITEEEAYRHATTLLQHGTGILIQQYLSGRREALHVFYAHERFYACFAQWAKRTDPPLGGASVLRQSIPVPPDTGKQAQQLVRTLSLEGYSEVEFRRDDRGTPYLMEINPRLSASIELAIRAGVDFPYMLYQWACGEPIPHVEGYKTGLWMRYLRGDFTTTLASMLRQGRPDGAPPLKAFLDFGLTFFQPMCYDYVDWRDPLPAIAAAKDFIHFACQQVKQRLHHP